MKISWYEKSGKQGGLSGVEVDFTKNQISISNGEYHPITVDNMDDVNWCIKMNIKDLKEKIAETTIRLGVKKTKRIPIPDGYRIQEPLVGKKRTVFEIRLNDYKDKLGKLESVKVLLKT